MGKLMGTQVKWCVAGHKSKHPHTYTHQKIIESVDEPEIPTSTNKKT